MKTEPKEARRRLVTKLYCNVHDDEIIWREDAEIVARSEESLANAQLIAAATDLLEALKVCWASLQTYGDHPIIDMYCEKAINKAIGL